MWHCFRIKSLFIGRNKRFRRARYQAIQYHLKRDFINTFCCQKGVLEVKMSILDQYANVLYLENKQNMMGIFSPQILGKII